VLNLGGTVAIMCTVLLRFQPGSAWPLLIAAVRDEFLERPWDPPAAHWPAHPSIVGGRDRTAGGTWLAVDTATSGGRSPALAAILNGVRLPPPASGTRPSRGGLPLAALAGDLPSSFDGYDGFHLLHAGPARVLVVSWDGATEVRRELPPGDHILVNEGVDAAEDPLVPHFAPLFAALPDPSLDGATTEAAWTDWVRLLRGDGLATDDPRALLIRVEHEGRIYGSGSLALIGIGHDRVRYDFTPTPLSPQWSPILKLIEGEAP
jgi:hypothetical protein